MKDQEFAAARVKQAIKCGHRNINKAFGYCLDCDTFPMREAATR